MIRGLPTVLVFVVVAGALGWWAWSLNGGKAAEDAGGGQRLVGTHFDLAKLKVMTANVRYSDPKDGENIWQRRRDLLVKTILKYEPDVVGCQEVTPSQGAFLIKELGAWYTHYPRAGVGKVEGDQGGARGLLGAVGETFVALNTLFYRTDRFEQVDGEAGLVLPGSFQEVATENTFYTLAVLRELKSAEGKRGEWIVVDTHLRHQEDFATACALELRKKILRVLKKYPEASVVVMGDMNRDRTSGVYRMLSLGSERVGDGDGLGKLTDAFDYSKRPEGGWGTYHGFSGRGIGAWPTDLIFAGKGWKSEGAEILRDGGEGGVWPSDHFLVQAVLDRE